MRVWNPAKHLSYNEKEDLGYVALHGIRMIVICILAILSIFLPYFPGKYDHLAVIVSAVVQIAGFISLLLVPIGVSWLIYERVQRKKAKTCPRNSAGFAIAAQVVLTLIVIASSFAALGGIGSFRGSLMLGIVLAVIFIYLTISVIIPRIKQIENRNMETLRYIPLYLLIIPLAVFIFRFAFISPAVNYSTSRAIEQSAVLIQNLEDYFTENGLNPLSLQGLWKD